VTAVLIIASWLLAGVLLALAGLLLDELRRWR
jgi:hypothetical protein